MSSVLSECKPSARLFYRAVRTAAVTVLVLMVMLAIVAVMGCAEHLFYYPTGAVYSTPAEHGLAFEQVEFTSGDGTRLTGWFIPAVGGAKGTVVHCHGNAQNMTAHWQFAKFLPGRGYNLFVFDYRGYGRSEGRVSRQGTVDDACAALAYVMGRADVDAKRVGLFGQSLGGAVAVVAAARDKRVKGLVVESAFSSYRDEAAYVLRRNPLTYLVSWPLSRLLIRRGLDPADYIAELSPRPVLIIHGAADRTVPCEMGRELAERAAEPKELWLVDEAGHTGAIYARPDEYEVRVTRLFERAFGTRR